MFNAITFSIELVHATINCLSMNTTPVSLLASYHMGGVYALLYEESNILFLYFEQENRITCDKMLKNRIMQNSKRNWEFRKILRNIKFRKAVKFQFLEFGTINYLAESDLLIRATSA